jgi:phosphoribosylglycinamide formyltransferase 1
VTLPIPNGPLRLAVFISGTGRTLKNILDRIDAGRLTAEVCLVIASTPYARGLQFAEKAGIPIQMIERKDFDSRDEYSEAMFRLCREAEIDLVVLGGFVKLLTLPEDFEDRVLNIHPSLIPSFCGKGFYGHHVHEAVLKYGAKLSGCTVHFVDSHYDRGPVILQRAVPVLDDDTPDTLNDRVFEAECEAFPDALQLLATGRISLAGRKVRIAAE